MDMLNSYSAPARVAWHCQAHGYECPGPEGDFPCESFDMLTCPDCLEERLTQEQFDAHAGGMCAMARTCGYEECDGEPCTKESHRAKCDGLPLHLTTCPDKAGHM